MKKEESLFETLGKSLNPNTDKPNIKIYGSHQYVHERDIPWYKLEVINQWDFTKHPICFDYSGDTLISYCLTINTRVSNTEYKSTIVENITDEMKSELLSMNYTLSKK